MAQPKTLAELPTPAFLVDFDRVRQNCKKMLETCKDLNLKLRAQTKTHKTVEGAIFQTGGTKSCVVTSTLPEAEMLANAGFDDILYGYPLTPEKFQRCWNLHKICKFSVYVDNEFIIDSLFEFVSRKFDAEGENFAKPLSVFLAIDCGDGREGIWWENSVEIKKILDKICGIFDPNWKKLIFLGGVYVHCGDSYVAKLHGSSPKAVAESSIERLLKVMDIVKKTCEPEKMKNISFGIGSTPTCSVPVKSMSQLSEIHPDTMQVAIGSCSENEIACCVATRVIGHYPHRSQMLIDAGFLAFTKQGFAEGIPKSYIFKNHPELKIVAMTQEIATVASDDEKLDYDKYPIGSMLFVYPFHSCATAAQHPIYYVHDGEKIVEIWRPCKGW